MDKLQAFLGRDVDDFDIDKHTSVEIAPNAGLENTFGIIQDFGRARHS